MANAKKVARSTKNGVMEPPKGTIGAELWAIADSLKKKLKRTPARFEFLNALKPSHNRESATVQFCYWRKYNGLKRPNVNKAHGKNEASTNQADRAAATKRAKAAKQKPVAKKAAKVAKKKAAKKTAAKKKPAVGAAKPSAKTVAAPPAAGPKGKKAAKKAPKKSPAKKAAKKAAKKVVKKVIKKVLRPGGQTV